MTEQVEGGIRPDPVKGKLAHLNFDTRHHITPKKNGDERSSKKETQIQSTKEELCTTNTAYVVSKRM